mgnify:CR=1 FL=1
MRLTNEQWAEVKPPFWYIRVEGEGWTTIHREMICKWIEAHCGGWFYYDGAKTYVFERSGDYMMFRIWIKGDPFAASEGEIGVPEQVE